MLPLLSILGLAALGFISLVVLLYVVLPLKRMSAYSKDGRPSFFYPIYGYFKLMSISQKKKGDVNANPKDFGRYTPEKKILISNMMSNAAILLRDSAYIKEFVQKQQYYHKAGFGEVMLPLLGPGLVLAEGDVWKRHRKIISNSFHYEFLKTNIPVVQATTRQFLDKITPEDYKGYSAIPRIQDITGEIVGKIFFGENLSKYTFEGKPLTLGLADLVADLGLCARSPLIVFFGPKVMNMPFFPRYNRTMKRIHEFRAICAQIIADRKTETIQSNDLLASLLATQQAEDVAQRFSDEDIINEFITFFVAGMDTTGHLIAMTLYNLARYPQYLKDLKEERQNTYNQEKNVTADTLQKMDVLHTMLKETLRLYTPASGPFTRVAIEDHKLVDLDVKKGDQVRAEFFSTFFNEKYFENPEEFKPYRWNTPSANLDPYAFIPFSAGPRNCIGQHLAIFESKVILSEFLERFDFKLPEDYKLIMTVRFLYEPLNDMKLLLTPIKA